MKKQSSKKIHPIPQKTSAQHLSMSLPTSQRGGVGLSIQQASAPCDLGWVLAGTTEKGICFIGLDDAPGPLLIALQNRFPKAQISAANSAFSEDLMKIVAYIDSRAKDLHLPLDIQGTTFQQQVWRSLIAIPPGTTLTYSELGERIGRPKSARAVANACGANPVAVLIPCHRIIRRDGSVGGYRWGIKRKRILLEREQMAKKKDTGQSQD
ncbi:MAG: methylated-DNA--[protein]-cysteine S-methyltransferase [Proteobacteria bacterium]|nr:methylated-DNA--[protein]-cysteine S-methyltransferase [Pseudomonadota bacterium]MBU1058513.1 methylated-DNA--[protein]-cysteine S-methyltransferase [Pseudomonadota bacterium]